MIKTPRVSKAERGTLPRPRIGRPRTAELRPEQIEFLDWLVTPEAERDEDARSELAYARKKGIARSTLRFWQRNLAFREAWWKRLDDMNVRPDKVQAVINAMQKIASNHEDKYAVSAAKVYLDYVDKATPKRDPVIFDDSAAVLAEMSDEELDELARGLVFEGASDDDE